MKKLLLTIMIASVAIASRAQWLSPEAVNGALMGTFIGGIAGGNCHDGFSGDGAAIGAGIGLAVGALAGEARRQNQYYAEPATYQPAVVATPGYGYSSTYVYYAPNNYTAPGYYYRPERPNYAVGGTLLGAASGALIGYGSGNTGEGAAIGAASGLVLGGIAEYAARKKEDKSTKPQPASTVQQQPPAQPAAYQPPQLVQSEITFQPAANSTYYWTAPPRQIPDAPRVPDAPTF
ncbi:MAG TPA: glycine zipper family protein [Verrucomicrobiota bacterium]|nr:glycine zipper family protein [Verrucomicrobiota bacterium]